AARRRARRRSACPPARAALHRPAPAVAPPAPAAAPVRAGRRPTAPAGVGRPPSPAGVGRPTAPDRARPRPPSPDRARRCGPPAVVRCGRVWVVVGCCGWCRCLWGGVGVCGAVSVGVGWCGPPGAWADPGVSTRRFGPCWIWKSLILIRQILTDNFPDPVVFVTSALFYNWNTFVVFRFKAVHKRT